MLSKSTIRAQRRVINSNLVDLAIVLSPAEQNDGYGVKVPTFLPVQIDVPCRAESMTRVPKAGTDDKGLSVLTEWHIMLPVGTQVRVGWRLKITDRVFEVEDVNNIQSDASCITCFCFDVER